MKAVRDLNSIFLGLLLSVSCLNCSAEILELISVSSNGLQANKSGTEDKSVVSANGRYVAFQSFANNLVAGDTNNNIDIFVRDRFAKTTVRVNVSSTGLQANLDSSNPSISADGRYIAFESQANNLVPGDINNNRDIFVHDRLNHITIRVSVDVSGKAILGSGRSSYKPSISADGRYVAFSSGNDKLVPGDTNNREDIFVYDVLFKKISLVSVSSTKVQGKSNANNAVISADGRYIAFESISTNLVPGDTNGRVDVFVHDRVTAKTVRVSTSSSGVQGNDGSTDPSISANGRFIAFGSWATNLVPGDTNANHDIFVHDLITHQTNRISVSSAGLQGNSGSSVAFISADGTKILFNSFASNLVPGIINNGYSDLFLHDRSTRRTSQITYDLNGGHSFRETAGFSLNAEGSILTFSVTDGLIPRDKNNNIDVIARSNESLSIPKADLQISSILKPASTVVNGINKYIYKITNNSNYVVSSVRLNHLITNGLVSSFIPSAGACGLYSNISICYLGSFNPGQSKTLTVNVKAIRKNVIQQMNVFDPSRQDINEINNWLSVITLVQ